jgi:hypothetical protein
MTTSERCKEGAAFRANKFCNSVATVLRVIENRRADFQSARSRQRGLARGGGGISGARSSG